MTAKQFFKTFRWGTIVPNALTLLGAILSVCVPFGDAPAIEITIGVMFALAGIVLCVAYLLERMSNIILLLAGAAQLAVAIWLFFSAPISLYLFSVALGVVVILRAAAEIYVAATEKGNLRLRIARIVIAAIFIALMIVTFVNPFTRYSDTCKFTGALFFVGMFFAALRDVLKEGLFEEEEELKFRPVKKEK